MELLGRSIRFVTPIAIVLCGGGVMIWLVQSKPAPGAHAAPAHTLTVAVQTVVPRTAVMPVVGYGTVRPKNQVQMVPQVSGELVFCHADLAEGKIIAKGELLFELDPSVYQSRVQRAEAGVRALKNNRSFVKHGLVIMFQNLGNYFQKLSILQVCLCE